MLIKTIGIVGAGVMGAGIAQRCAAHGYLVVLVDKDPQALKAADRRIRSSLDKFLQKGKITAMEKSAILDKIQFVPCLEGVKDCELVIEAVPEDRDLKQSVFVDLEAVCSSRTILATNTSSIPVRHLGGATSSPERVLGIHFMNPVPLMHLVEMIRTEKTSAAVFKTCRDFVESLGCEVVESKDSPGFIINRILMPMLNDAACALEAGVASAQDIDRAMVAGTHQPMGPLALADTIGLDTVLAILQTLHREFESERYKPSPLLEKLVRQNHLGRKTGRGFYDYEASTQSSPLWMGA